MNILGGLAPAKFGHRPAPDFHTARMPPGFLIARAFCASREQSKSLPPSRKSKQLSTFALGLGRMTTATAFCSAPPSCHNPVDLGHMTLRICVEQSSSPLFAQGGRPTFAMTPPDPPWHASFSRQLSAMRPWDEPKRRAALPRAAWPSGLYAALPSPPDERGRRPHSSLPPYR